MEHGAAGLGIRAVAARAGLVHASFYNYYPDTGALLDGLAGLLLTTHAMTVAPLREGIEDPVTLFAVTTRQTLRLAHDAPQFSALLFDSGIPIDRLLTALHEPLRMDLRRGIKSGAFVIPVLDIAVTMVAGSMMSLAVDLHRRRAKPASIDDMTFHLLRMLGTPAEKAQSAARAKIAFRPAPPVPLSWKALGMAAPETRHAA